MIFLANNDFKKTHIYLKAAENLIKLTVDST
jgi:hypothetical protein